MSPALAAFDTLPWWNEVKYSADKHGIPAELLYAMCQQESNYQYTKDLTGPYPFVLNIAGKSKYFQSKQEAIDALDKILISGRTNVDVGMCQLNYKWQRHRLNDADASVWLDPIVNLQIAALILEELWLETGSLSTAVGFYHNRGEVRSRNYKVLVANKLKLIRLKLNTAVGD